MTITALYDFFTTLYLVTDPEQKPRILTNMEVSPGHVIRYGLSCGTDFSWHFAEEMTEEINLLTKVK